MISPSLLLIVPPRVPPLRKNASVLLLTPLLSMLAISAPDLNVAPGVIGLEELELELELELEEEELEEGVYAIMEYSYLNNSLNNYSPL